MYTRKSLIAAAAAAAAAAAFALGACEDEGDGVAEEERGEPTAAGEEEGDGDDGADDDRMLSDPEEMGSVTEGHGLELGDELPGATVTDVEGEDHALSDLASDGAVLVGFYRGGWCAYCDAHVAELAQSYSDVADRDTELVLVSADAPNEAADTEAAHGTDFPLLSDSDLAAHETFRIVKEVEAPDGEVEEEGIPSLFLFSAEGELLWQHVDEDITARPRVEQIIEVLEAHDLEPTA